MCRVKSLCLAFIVVSALASAAVAGVTYNGDYSPVSGSWGTATNSYIGTTGSATQTVGTGSIAITSGGTLGSKAAYLGYINGTSGTMSVDASKWTASSSVYAGFNGSGVVNLTTAGTVTSGAVYLGNSATGSGTVTVAGGSKWSSTDKFYVGNLGTGVLTVTSGTVATNSTTYIGAGTGGGNTPAAGTLTVDGASSRFTSGTSSSGSSLYVGNYGSATLKITNGGYVKDSYAYIDGGTASAATILVDGSNSQWINTGNFLVGNGLPGLAGPTSVTVSHGGSISFASGFIGGRSSAANVVTVDGSSGGTASKFAGTSSGTAGLCVGYNGGDGVLNITNGGSVSIAGTTYVAFGNTSSSYDGGNSFINFGASNGGSLSTVSLYVHPDRLQGAGTVSTKGLVSDVDLTFTSTTLNQVIPGFGSTVVNLDVTGAVSKGDLGVTGAHTLAINSGVVNSAAGYIGWGTGTASSTATIGEGAKWINTGDLYVGREGVGSLTITNGTVSNKVGRIASTAASEGNLVTVSGTAAQWICSSGLNVGENGTGYLYINNGALVQNGDGMIAAGPTYSYGSVSVDGNGTVWHSTGNMHVGDNNSGDLSITNGALVQVDGETVLGFAPNTRGTIVFGGSGGTLATKSLSANPNDISGNGTIKTNGLISDVSLTFNGSGTGTGVLGGIAVNVDMSSATTAGALGVGFWGSGGVVNISNGATVYSIYGQFGQNKNTSGVITVAGSSTTWTVAEDITIGNEGSGTMNIQSGAVVSSANGTVGSLQTGIGNVRVTGPNSAWNNSGDLVIGGYGGCGSLTIDNGGAVTCNNAVMAEQSGTAIGVVSVGGVGTSSWTIAGDLLVGGVAQSATLNINAGGTVAVTGATTISGSEIFPANAKVIFSGGNLATKSLFVTPTDVSGAGTITTNGLVSDVNLTFDATHGLNQTIPGFGSVAMKLDMNGGTANGVLGAGYRGNGSLTINGITVTSSGGTLGYFVGSTGVATVANGGTWISTGPINLAYTGDSATGYSTGILNINNGGTVVCDSIGSFGSWSQTGNMAVNFNGGTLKAYAAGSSEWVGTGLYDRGHINIAEGGAILDTNGQTMSILKPLEHAGTLATDGGVTKVGTGMLTLAGMNTYTGWTGVSGGTLSISQACLAAASNVHVDTGAILDLGAANTVHYLFLGGLPVAAGTYDATTSPTYLSGIGNLTVSGTALQGDLDLNGTVNSTDLGLLLSHYNNVNASFAWSWGDVNGDHTVNSTDLGLLLSHYNQVSPATSTVPEPSTILLAVAGLIGLLVYAWRQQK